MKKRNPRNVKLSFFNNLPSHLVIDILSRLPVRSIIICKCVDKSWLHLIETEKVVKSRLSKSVPGLLASKNNEDGSVLHRFYEFEEETVRNPEEEYVDDVEVHKLHYNPATPWFDIPCYKNVTIVGSANGLLFWHDHSSNAKDLFICNPITREYIKIACVEEDFHQYHYPFVTYGFGVSKISGQHKVVRTSRMEMSDGTKFDYHVYTLGTGSWRRIYSTIEHSNRFHGRFVFVNGKLHWLSLRYGSSPRICFLDLGTELFGTPTFPLPVTLSSKCFFSLFAMWDSLCLCRVSYEYDYTEITVWSAKEDKFWERKFVIRYNPPDNFCCPFVWLPVKIFNDGDILVEWRNTPHAARLDKMGTWDTLKFWDRVIIHTPCFLSLKSFQMENVISF